MLKQRHGGMDRREDGPRPAQPKSSNTQLDECLRCQQLQGTGVDQDLAVTCKDKKKKNPLCEGLFAHYTACRYGHSAPGKVLSSHPNILGLFTSGVMVLLKDTHHTSVLHSNSVASVLQRVMKPV